MLPMQVIAHIHTGFATKFGVPRQSGLVPEVKATVIFEPPYRNPDALRGIEGFSHLWLLWHFSEVKQEGWSPTVRPPRLGGNTRMGVFATRSPYRPNPIGLSSVRLEKVEWDTPQGPVLHIAGADLMDGTPIFDIKPYLAYTDSHPDATDGFLTGLSDRAVAVDCPDDVLTTVPQDKSEAILAVLAHDPRPTYQNDPTRVYGMAYDGLDIRFTVKDGVLHVQEIIG